MHSVLCRALEPCKALQDGKGHGTGRIPAPDDGVNLLIISSAVAWRGDVLDRRANRRKGGRPNLAASLCRVLTFVQANTAESRAKNGREDVYRSQKKSQARY